MKTFGNHIRAMIAITGALSAATVSAQTTEGLRIGVLGGVNYNYVDAPTQQFVQVSDNSHFAGHDFSKAAFFDGYAGVTGEYLFNSTIGATLRATYDARCVQKEDNGSTFTPHLTYISVEPGVRFNLGMPEFHANVGGTVAIKVQGTYDYNGDASEGVQEVKDVEMTNVNDVAFGAWAGLGYDIRLNDPRATVGWYITPFAEASYLFDQKKPDATMTEEKDWNTLTVRAGAQVKVQF